MVYYVALPWDTSYVGMSFTLIYTGVLASHSLSRDIHVNSLSITFHGVELLSDTRLELNTGRRYGFVGLNGSGMLRGGRGGERWKGGDGRRERVIKHDGLRETGNRVQWEEIRGLEWVIREEV